MKVAWSLLFATSFIASTAFANGPIVPCADCETVPHFLVPESGWWFVPGEPGTGLNVEVQNGVIFGAYYAFNEDGSPLWLTFSGTLERPEGAPGHLSVSAPLFRYEGGACLGCAYELPDAFDDVGQISLTFPQRNLMIVQANGADPVHMVPVVGGVDVGVEFLELTNYGLPLLTGPWTVAVDNLAIEGNWGRGSLVLHFGEKRVLLDGQGLPRRVVYSMDAYTGSGVEIAGVGQFACEVVLNEELERSSVECAIRMNLQYPGRFEAETLEFPVRLANIGDSKIEAFNAEEQIRVSAFRLDY